MSRARRRVEEPNRLPPFLLAALASVLVLAAATGLLAYLFARDGESPAAPAGNAWIEEADENPVGYLVGSVRSLADGKPLPNAIVRAEPSEAIEKTSEALVASDGTFRLPVSERFSGTLFASAPGYLEKSVHVPRAFVEEGLRFDFSLVAEE